VGGKEFWGIFDLCDGAFVMGALKNIVSYVLCISLGYVLSIGLQSFIVERLPVVENMRIVELQRTETEILARIQGKKVREECRPIGGSQIGYIVINGVSKKVEFQFLKDNKTIDKVDNRTTGPQDFGWWAWFPQIEDSDKIEAVEITIDHFCGALGQKLAKGKIGSIVYDQNNAPVYRVDYPNLNRKTSRIGPFYLADYGMAESAVSK